MPSESQPDLATAFDQTLAGAMSRELHKTAQPLTILQGLLEIMRARVSAGDECCKFVERVGEEAPRLAGCDECKCFLKRAGEELPRLTSSFNDVRKLAGLQRPARDTTNFLLSALVRDVLQTLRADLDIAGITVDLEVRPNEDGIGVVASHSRLFSAIRLVLMALADCFDVGNQIKISTEMDGSNAMIRFWPSRYPQPEAIAERDRLLSALASQLEFAHLLLKSLGGELRFNRTPDIIVMSLPAAQQSVAQDRQGKAMHV